MTTAQITTIGTVLVVDDEDRIRKLISIGLERAGYEVLNVASGLEALASISEIVPDVVVCDVMMPDLDGFSLLTELRANPATEAIPFIFLTARNSTADLVQGMGLGADDYLAKPFDMSELTARVQSKIERPPVPSASLTQDRLTGLLGEQAFWQGVSRELVRYRRGGRPGVLACVALYELPQLRERLGSASLARVARDVTGLIGEDIGPLDLAGRNRDGLFVMMLPEASPEEARVRLRQLSARIVAFPFGAAGERLDLTPVTSFVVLRPGDRTDEPRTNVLLALDYAVSTLDLQPVQYDPAVHLPRSTTRPQWWRVVLERCRLPVQIVAVQAAPLIVPFIVLVALYHLGIDVAPLVYLLVVAVLLITAALIWTEGVLAREAPQPPDEPLIPFPAASAIIAAYLPNEAATIVETITAFLKVEYPAPLQIILAYNTPRPMPVEALLQEIAARDPRFMPIKVERSTSKAQNVNAAISRVRGEFVGIFDADHHPDPDSFSRAWRWLSSGFDIVQGHCLVRNGDESWVARMVAVEFEAIYAVSHPGRARLHGFGIFGGSNGYWRASVLRRIRMHGFMLTEDIDSSLRAVEGGYRIASDRNLISRELAPVTARAFWNQRIRWSQGWFQVSLKHIWLSLRSPHLTRRQKLGFFHLLVWRECYPWISVQIFPVIAFWAWKNDGIGDFTLVDSVFFIATVFTLSVGPGQTLFAYLLAHPEIKRHPLWFMSYLFVGSIMFAEIKNVIARVAQIKELMREKQWKVTPRTAARPGD